MVIARDVRPGHVLHDQGDDGLHYERCLVQSNTMTETGSRIEYIDFLEWASPVQAVEFPADRILIREA